MSCPKCKEAGEQHRVFDLGGSSTLLHYSPFFDESGKRHVHDPNTLTLSYKCSNNHTWTEKRKRSCWCGWPDKEGAIDH